MSEPISFKTKLTIDDSLKVGKVLRNQSWFYRYDIVLTSLIVFVGFWLAILAMSDDVSSLNAIGATVFSAVPAALTGILVAVYHKWIIPKLARRRIMKIFQSSPSADQEVLITLSEEGVEIKGELSSSVTTWDAITKVVESKDHLLFYSGALPPFLFFRLSSLNSEETLNSLKQLIRHKLGGRAFVN